MNSNRISSRIPILNIGIDNVSKEELLEKLDEGLLVTPNVDHIMKLQKDRGFYDVYQQADWIICDSKIVSLASRFFGTPIKEVIPGSTFFFQYCDYHRDNSSISIFLLGAKPGVAITAMKNINIKIGRNIIVGAHSPSFGFETNTEECRDIVDLINNSGANVLVVGVGAPKQEKWILKYRSDFKNIKLFLPLGATIDFEAGNIRRAPKLFQTIGMEWLFRLLSEPKRLWRRYLLEDSPFIFYMFLYKFGLYKNRFEK